MSVARHCDSPASRPTRPPQRRQLLQQQQQHMYPQRRFRLRSGDRVWVRQLRRKDAPALAAAFEQLSARSRYLRFHSGQPRLSEQMVTYLTDIDHHDHEALVAVSPGSDGIIIGVARFIRDPGQPETAEVAVAVVDSWQRRGLGTLLLRRLARRATEVGVTDFVAYILTENGPTMELVRRLGAGAVDEDDHGSTVTTRMDLADWAVDDRVLDDRVLDDWAVVDWGGSLLRAFAATEAVLLPRLARPLLDLSVELIRILVVPVTTFLGPQGMTRTTSNNGGRISRYRRESCVNATHLACTKCSGNEGLSARPEVGAGVDLDAPTQR